MAARRAGSPCRSSRDPQIHFDYEIAMGVRFGEKEWKNTLDQWIAGHRQDIDRILVSYRIPLVEASAAR